MLSKASDLLTCLSNVSVSACGQARSLMQAVAVCFVLLISHAYAAIDV